MPFTCQMPTRCIVDGCLIALFDLAVPLAASCMCWLDTQKLHMQMRKVLAAQQQLPNHQIASIDSLHSLTGLSKRTVASALQACRLRELSLEASTVTCTAAGKAQDRTPLVDQMSSSDMLDHQPELDDPLADSCVAETLMEGALQKLPLAEATVLHHVYGLQDGLPKSRPQVSHAAWLLKVCRRAGRSQQSCMHVWVVLALDSCLCALQ